MIEVTQAIPEANAIAQTATMVDSTGWCDFRHSKDTKGLERNKYRIQSYFFNAR